MRLVLDTNIALSGLLWGGAPGQLIDAAIGQRIELVSSTALLAELQGVLSRDKFAAQLTKRRVTVSRVFDGYVALVLRVSPLAVPRVIQRDPDDDHVIACAVTAQANAIVSGDSDLSALGSYQGIPIINARRALTMIR